MNRILLNRILLNRMARQLPKRVLLVLISLTVPVAACAESAPDDARPGQTADGDEGQGESLADSREVHLTNVRQLTFDGQNAEAYFSFDGSKLVFQRTPREGGCDQIYSMNLDGSEQELVSTGDGRTTCSYYYPSGDRILYSSTHHHDPACPPDPDFSMGYVWAVYDTYDVFAVDADGSMVQLTQTDGYDAEATFSPVGDRVVFTSTRDGDLDLYSMLPDGSDVQRLTNRLGYDGGAFYSPDGSQIVWRAHYPDTDEAAADYTALLDQGLIRPSQLDIWIMDADGSNKHQITDNGAANFGPYWHPDGTRILFSSNMDDPEGREFDLYMINTDGSGLERITFTSDFDGFPVFSPDGRYLVWGSNRNNAQPRETNVFIAEWVD